MMNNNVNISYATAGAGDEGVIRDLLKVFRGDESNFDISKFVIAKDGEKIIGCIRIKVIGDDCLELSSLGVLSEYRGQGIGSRLAEEVLAREKRRPVFLLTSDDKETFYKNFGFAIVAPESLPQLFKKEYDRVVSLPFAKNIKVIAMSIA